VPGFIPNELAIDALFNAPGGPVWQELEKVGKNGVAMARNLAPVSTSPEDIPGKLRDSIRFVVEENGPVVSIGSDVSYALYVEFGTSDMAAQPFLRPVLMSLKP
jgi:HK97 gp10 family phage protein